MCKPSFLKCPLCVYLFLCVYVAELEFVQIIIILLVMTLMIVVIICLLNHYWLPALAFLSRNQGPLVVSYPSCLCLVIKMGFFALCFQVMPGRLNSNMPHFMQQQQLCRFQPTYPYLQQEIINLPPLICLSDGEELLPYKGPCSLQLRHPEQQLELSRAAVRAPPNRTVFDSDLIDIYSHSKSPQAPSSNTGTNNASATTEGPPPSYSEVMGGYPSSTPCYSQYNNNAPPTDNRLGCDSSQMLFHAGSSGPESTAKTSTDLNS
uniref:Low density lipoprotein receptor class A domain containing 4a n=1 Tax=Lates calcarifer TaxID=8187 RepID=A0A4W6E604_LATCA